MAFELDIDPDDLMTQVVDIQIKGDTQGVRGGPTEEYTTVQSNVACLIVPQSTELREMTGRRLDVINHMVIFMPPVQLSDLHRIVYTDPVQGVRYLFPEAARNIAEVGVIGLVMCAEYPSGEQ